MHLALRSLQETVPELLARVPVADHNASIRPGAPPLIVTIPPAIARQESGSARGVDESPPIAQRW
jgi:hypothetical protein